MSTIFHDLETAERHVQMGESHIARQRKLIDRLPAGSPILAKARQLLETFEEIQLRHIEHRDALREAVQRAQPEQRVRPQGSISDSR